MTKKKRTSIYPSPPIDRVLAANNKNTSARLADVADRYLAICSDHLPDFTEAEWSAIRDALNDYWTGDIQSIRVMAINIEDADRLEGLGDKWDIDAKALAKRIDAMSLAEKTSIIEAVEKWWSVTTFAAPTRP